MTSVRIGVGGWTYEPWRGVFYPEELKQKDELAYASRQFSAIEINGTYYGAQKPETFEKWHDETPDDFVFTVKAPRFATNRRVLAESGKSVERFLTGGVMRLGQKLGPINWQFLPTKQFDPDDFAAFLALLPDSVEGKPVRHAVEVRHESFRNAAFVALARQRKIAIVHAGDSDHPEIEEATAPFAYARIMGTSEDEKLGYSGAKLDAWAKTARKWAGGKSARDVFLFVISGFKQSNPAAAMALIERMKRR